MIGRPLLRLLLLGSRVIIALKLFFELLEHRVGFCLWNQSLGPKDRFATYYQRSKSCGVVFYRGSGFELEETSGCAGRSIQRLGRRVR